MSILLDAVTRAKQQDQQLDPVITPRAQYEAMQPKWPLVVKLGLVGTGLGGAIALAWVLSGQGSLANQRQAESLSAGQAQAVQSKAVQPKVIEAKAIEAKAIEAKAIEAKAIEAKAIEAKAVKSETTQPLVSQSPQSGNDASNGTGIKLAGKVALPVPVERPILQAKASTPATVVPQPRRQPAEIQSVARNKALGNDGLSAQSSEEPIILGANANQRGRDLLSSLKAQVDEAAADVGLESAYVAEQGSDQALDQMSEQLPEPDAQQRPAVKDTSKLVAAFEAALKEVEKENAVATPVTEPKLDPIPVPKADELPKYGQLPAGLQLQVPEFNILAHVYANDPKNRWLNVDGAELQQGDMIGGKLKIVEIRPRDVVLEVAGTEFKVPAI
ncbi:general secretion pathway protein GspB [Shewanella sp. Isolate7]|uniref:general secretion pathway protein GspB n=1 Tax=Shewanella sp. Isolate7 TaxID=2908528 RepID=UPI001EFE9A32|nr:general secretion pathway protein GspB [Shewanella sp. Isolate7]MCG9721396.1 general secretion pathway protein GspB [Shewanella sp. Isolate7]